MLRLDKIKLIKIHIIEYKKFIEYKKMLKN